ncbi:MAG TPA: hypothetical protein VEF06_11380 [Bryobacteraceae bacterium]|nr:hypothetical protein [Bryobacteraceae bacterium]
MSGHQVRTTLTLEPAVAERIRKRMLKTGGTLKSVINEALRAGLRALDSEESPQIAARKRFVVEPRKMGLRPGIDPDRISHFAEELEDEAVIRRLAGPR